MRNEPSCANMEARVRDRVLLYIRSMNLEPVEGLAIAMESLRRAGPQADVAAAMRALRELLCERGHEQTQAPGRAGPQDATPITSTPPMNRCVMIAEPLDRTPIRSALKGCLRKAGTCIEHAFKRSAHRSPAQKTAQAKDA